MNFLIIRLSSLGDVIHTLSAVKRLRDRFDGCNITWLVESESAGILQKYPGINRVIVWDKTGWKNLLRGCHLRVLFEQCIGFVRAVRSAEYDAVFDFQGLLKSAVIGALSRSRKKIGFTGAREGGFFFYNEKVVSAGFNEHAIKRNLKLLDAVGITCQEPCFHPLFDDADKDGVSKKLSFNHPDQLSGIITIHPTARWKTKILPPETVVRLCRMLLEAGRGGIALVGSQHDRAYIQTIQQHVSSKRIVNLAGDISLTELAALLSGSRLLIAMDSGPMHLGSAVGAAVVSVFGPTAPWRTGPFGKNHSIVRKDLPCAPCYRKKACPEGHHGCMRDITAEEIVTAARSVMEI